MKKSAVITLLFALLLSGCSLPSMPSLPSPQEINQPEPTVVSELPTLPAEQREALSYEVREYADVLVNIGQAGIGIPNTSDHQVMGMVNGVGYWADGSTAVTLTPPFLVDNSNQMGKVGVITIANWNLGKEFQSHYVVLFQGSVPGSGITQMGHLFLGDGLVIKNMEQRPAEGDATRYYVDITYLDRNPGEPLTTKPTVEKVRTIEIIRGEEIVGGECAYSCLSD